MYEKARNEMVRKYVLDAGIEDEKIISAIQKIPRHLFVESAIAHKAYSGSSLPIGFGQTISHPKTVAWMTQMLELKGHEKVLEIGTGSGYQAAVLAELGVKVFTIERVPQLADRARAVLEKLGYYTIAIRKGDGTVGWTQFAPFDRIIVTAGSPVIPDVLINQLADPGKIIIPVGDKEVQKFNILVKQENKISKIQINKGSFVPLIGRKGWGDR
jgi:protein-L-isoaspartate(D-aspartate) O-methyltransferase